MSYQVQHPQTGQTGGYPGYPQQPVHTQGGTFVPQIIHPQPTANSVQTPLHVQNVENLNVQYVQPQNDEGLQPPPYVHSTTPVHTHPSAPEFDPNDDKPAGPSAEDIKATQRAEWLEKKGKWKWDTASKVALVALVALSGAALFGVMAAPGGFAAGIVLGIAGSLVTISISIAIAASMDWTNYADPDQVAIILNRIRNSETPVGQSTWNNLARYGIISEKKRKEIAQSGYPQHARNLETHLQNMRNASEYTAALANDELLQVSKQLYCDHNHLPETKEVQTGRKNAIEQKQTQLKLAEGEITKAKAFIAEVHSKVTNFDPRPTKLVEVQTL